MAHPLIKELGITPEIARKILHQLESSKANQHSIADKTVARHGDKTTALQWDPALSLSFIQHYHKRLGSSTKSVSDVTSRDWAAVRQAVSKKFPKFVRYSNNELFQHIKLLQSYARVMRQVIRMPGTDFDSGLQGKYVFQKSSVNWDSLINRVPHSQQRYVMEFAKRKDNRAVYEILEFQINQKAKTFSEKLTVKSGLIGAKRINLRVNVGREKRRTI